MTRFLRRLAREPDIAPCRSWSTAPSGRSSRRACSSSRAGPSSTRSPSRRARPSSCARRRCAAVRRGGRGYGLRRARPGGLRRSPGRRPDAPYQLLAETAGYADDIILDPEHLRDRHRDRGARPLRRSRFFEATRRMKAALPDARISGGVSATCRSRSAATTVSARRSTRCSCTTRSRRTSTWRSSNAGALPQYDDIDHRTCSSGSRTSSSTAGADATERLLAIADPVKGAPPSIGSTDGLGWRELPVRRAPQRTRWSRASTPGSSRTPRRLGLATSRPLDVIEGPVDGRHERRRRPVRPGRMFLPRSSRARG